LYSKDILTDVDLVQIIRRVESNALVLIPIFKAKLADLEKELEDTMRDPSNYLESYKQILRDRIKREEKVPKEYNQTANLKKELADTEVVKGAALDKCNTHFNDLRREINFLKTHMKNLENPIAFALGNILWSNEFDGIKKYVT
jgi:hypothetical protein